MRTLSIKNICRKSARFLLTGGLFAFPLLSLNPVAQAAAPARSGQPYAESICNTDSNIILCEDFNYTANFPSNGWLNPGLSTKYVNSDAGGRSFDAVGNYPAQPAGSPSGGLVKRADVANGAGEVHGCLWSDCERTTADNPTGVTYRNGTPLSGDLYFRYQIFFSSDYKWPSFDNKIFFVWPNAYVDKPSAQIDAGMIFGNGVFCSAINENFNDALSFRVGSNSGNFKIYPADANAGGYPEHPEYCTGDGTGDSGFDVSTTDPPNDTPHPGTVFRFKKGTWYTLEWRYKLSSPGVRNGTIEAWINGVKVYSDSDLETCGSGSASSCVAIAEFVQYFWYNAFQEGGGLSGYGLVDNLVISKSYIGPPRAGTTAPPASPTAPTGATVTP